MDAITRKGGLLYPMLVIAAISVIILSVMGIAAMMGWLPSALSGRESAYDHPVPSSDLTDRRAAVDPATAMAAKDAAYAAPHDPASRAPASCAGCGVVTSIRPVETPGQTSWLGAAGGAIIGGLLGHEIGRGGGRTAATVAGAGAGAYAGNEIEKHANKSVSYRVRVRMEDGTYRTFHEAAPPPYAVGQSVRVTDRGVVPLEERKAAVAAK